MLRDAVVVVFCVYVPTMVLLFYVYLQIQYKWNNKMNQITGENPGAPMSFLSQIIADIWQTRSL